MFVGGAELSLGFVWTASVSRDFITIASGRLQATFSLYFFISASPNIWVGHITARSPSISVGQRGRHRAASRKTFRLFRLALLIGEGGRFCIRIFDHICAIRIGINDVFSPALSSLIAASGAEDIARSKDSC